MSSITIREASLNDLAQLLEFEQGIVEAERPFEPNIKEKNVNYYDIGALITSENSVVLVAEESGALVASGYAKIRESKVYMKHDQHSYLGFMYTAPEHRGKRINRMILEGLLEWSKAKGIDEVKLEVYDPNEAAVKAYEKVGFKKHLVEMNLSLSDLA